MGLYTGIDLAEFVEQLRRAGFRVDTRQYLTAHELLLSCASHGMRLEDKADTLISYLGPIFCTSSEEQALFSEVLLDWFGETPPAPKPAPAQKPFKAWRRRRFLVPLAVSIAAILLVGSILLYYQFSTIALRGFVEAETPERNQLPAPEASLSFRGNPIGLDPNAHFVLAISRADGPGILKAELKGYVPAELQVDREMRQPLSITLKRIIPETKRGAGITVGEPEALIAPPVQDSEIPLAGKLDWFLTFLVGCGTAAVMFALLFAVDRIRQRLILRRLPVEDRPDLMTLPHGTPLAFLLGEHEYRRLSSSLRRPWGQDLLELNVAGTAESTCRNAGLFTPAYTPRRAMPEYLILIGRQSPKDHQAHLFDALTARLKEQGLIAERFYFRDDPRICFRPEEPLKHYPLHQLLAYHHRATLMFFGESAICFNPFSEQMEPWVDMLRSLPRRVLFTPEPPCHWTRREWELIKAGFIVLPAGEKGLQSFAQIEGDWRVERLFPARYARPFPSIIDSSGWRWLDRNEPPPNILEKLIGQLRDFLGPSGFTWMCSCAIYPEIAWPLTMHLAKTFGDEFQDRGPNTIIENTLPSLVRLPWFRYGFMPDWLRKKLISQMDLPEEKAFRRLLEHLLERLAQQTFLNRSSKEARSGIRIGRWTGPSDILKSSPADSPLHDEVFLGFMSGASRDPLAFRAPEALKRLFSGIGRLPVGLSESFQSSPRTTLQRVAARIRSIFTFRPSVARAGLSTFVGGFVMTVWLLAMPSAFKQVEPLPISGSNIVASVAFSPDSMTLASASSDHTARLWSVAARREVALLRGHNGAVTSVAFSPDGKFLASGSTDKTVLLWDAQMGSEVRRFIGHEGAVTSVAFSPDGKFLASGSTDKTVLLWDAQTGLRIMLYAAHEGAVISVAFSPDGKFLASGGTDNTVLLGDLVTGKQILHSLMHERALRSIAFSPDSKLLASGGSDMTVLLWDVTAARRVREIRFSERLSGDVVSMAFSLGSSMLALGSSESAALITNTGSPDLEPIILRIREGPVTSVDFSSDSKTLALAAANNVLLLPVQRSLAPTNSSISPPYLRVMQGEPAVFESRTTHDPDLQITGEDWIGPGGQTGRGARFQVLTDRLRPGEHEVRLTVLDSQGGTAVTKAYLEVTQGYSVSLRASPISPEIGSPVRFSASVKPETAKLEFRFHFGDGKTSGWTKESSIQHTYSTPDIYAAEVQVRSEDRIVGTSKPVKVVVYPSKQKTLRQSPTPKPPSAPSAPTQAPAPRAPSPPSDPTQAPAPESVPAPSSLKVLTN
jgi:WD40 repeat protein